MQAYVEGQGWKHIDDGTEEALKVSIAQAQAARAGLEEQMRAAAARKRASSEQAKGKGDVVTEGDSLDALHARFVPWHASTFPEATARAALVHLAGELGEAAVEWVRVSTGRGADVAFMLADLQAELLRGVEKSRARTCDGNPAAAFADELADIGLLSWAVARAAKIDIAAAMARKQATNEARRWGDANALGVIEHVP